MAVNPKIGGVDFGDVADALQKKKAPVVDIKSVSRDPDELSTLAKAGVETGQLPVSHIHSSAVQAQIPEQPSALSQAADVVGGVTSIAMFGAGFAPMIASLFSGISNGIKKIGEKTGLRSVENFGKKNAARIEGLNNKTFSDAMPKGPVTKAIASGSNKVFGVVGDTVGKVADVVGIKNPSVKNTAQEIKNLTKTVGKSNVLHGVMNTSFIAGSALSTVGVANGFRQGISDIKSMERDISGRDVSTFDVLFGKLSAPAAEAKSNLLKSSSLFGITDIVSLGATVLLAARNTISPAAFLIPQLVSMVGGKMLDESIAPEYKAFKQIYKQALAAGQQIPAEYYANFLGNASKVLRERGGAGSIFTQKLAEQYAEQKISPLEVIKRVSNGSLEQDVKAMIARAEAERKAAEKTAATVSAADTSTHSHVAALQGGSKAQEQKPVLGGHTAKLVADAAAANQSLGQALPAGA